MALTFGKERAHVMDEFVRGEIERTYLFVVAGSPLFNPPPTDEQRAQARAFADKLIEEGKAMEFLEATAPKPCPECGRV